MTERYVPAAGRAWLTRAYDPVIGLTMREAAWRPLVTSLAVSAPAAVVVDVGAGTGAQSIALARAGAAVVAIDGDPGALSIAARKAGADAVSWRTGLAGELPVETASADAVVMTLLLHHLDAGGKRDALAEAARVLRPGGRLVVADWGPPAGALPSLGFRVLRAVDGAAGLDDHGAGRLPSIIGGARFDAVTCHLRLPTAWGRLEVWTAARGA